MQPTCGGDGTPMSTKKFREIFAHPGQELNPIPLGHGTCALPTELTVPLASFWHVIPFVSARQPTTFLSALSSGSCTNSVTFTDIELSKL